MLTVNSHDPYDVEARGFMPSCARRGLRGYKGVVVGYTPLDEDVIHSTVFEEGPMVFAVWCAILATADSDGVSSLQPRTLVRLWGNKVRRDDVEGAWEVLKAPDAESQNQEHGGRRIIPHPSGGWFVVSHQKYRDKFKAEIRRAQISEAKRRQRDRDAGRMCGECDETENLGPPGEDGRRLCKAHKGS